VVEYMVKKGLPELGVTNGNIKVEVTRYVGYDLPKHRERGRLASMLTISLPVPPGVPQNMTRMDRGWAWL
jgi:hypothetical protein